MTDKRRLITLAPAVNQTDALKGFFGVTVDQLFQPGTPVPMNGYIGEFPANTQTWATNTNYNVSDIVIFDDLLWQCNTANNSGTSFDITAWNVIDFYIQEPDTERENYQLEPGMLSTNTSGTITNALVYPDMVNYISSNNGLVNNEQRLFETDYYSWAPPIDIDKFMNYGQYYWFGDSSGQSTLPILVLSSPILKYVGDGTNTIFAFPESISGISSEQESPAIYVNGVSVPFDESTGALETTPVAGAMIITTLFDNLYNAINGYSSFPIQSFLSYFNTYIGDGYENTFSEIVNPSSQPNVTEDGVYYKSVTGSTVSLLTSSQYATNSEMIILNTVPAYDDEVTVVQLNGLLALSALTNSSIPTGLSGSISLTELSSGMCVQLLDTQTFFEGWDESSWDSNGWDSTSPNYFVDGVGTAITFTNNQDLVTGISAQYTTINRASNDGNPWSIRNSWVHQGAFSWSDDTFPARQATRPIIEFIPNIVLFNYGYQRYDTTIGATVSNYTAAQIGSLVVGSVQADPVVNAAGITVPVTLQTGSLVLLLGTDQQIYYVNSIVHNSQEYYSLIALPYTVGDIAYSVPVNGDVISVQNSSTEFWYNGTTWSTAQVWSENIDPRFMLYDIEESPKAFNDNSTGAYPGNNFNSLVYPNGAIGGGNLVGGNRIFGYQIGSTADTTLQKYVSYDSNGYLMFENNTVPWTVGTTVYGYTYNSGSITSLACYGIYDNGLETQALWHKSDNPITTQLTINANGFYNIPLNLQANPLWEEVQALSKSEYSSHFTSIIANQTGISGAPYYSNDYRDTAQDLSVGTQILQHQSPMLKCMLLASNTSLDMISGLMYANQEYTRFKNRFNKKLVDFVNNGTISETATPATNVAIVLNALIIDKNDSFPFWLSTMAGGNYFIPPSPSFLGVMPLTNPSSTLIADTSFGTTVNMIQGHDGSLSPSFGDWRDDVFIALEQQIYNSIANSATQGKFATQERPIVDFEYYVSNVFYPNNTYPASNNYSVAEVNYILQPTFELWAQNGNFDYRTNGGYVSNDPFTWNYRGFLDRLGNVMPGSWRAIYRQYYDTVKPHTNPWEMLGFATKPDWWDTTYSYKPYGWNSSIPYYGRLNTPLWNDLEAGNIQHGPRQGINPRYARPGLSKVIPVLDDIPHSQLILLDPISTQIMLQAPDFTSAARNWVFGDEGPVEHLWRTSSSYSFAKAQALFLMKPARFVEIFWDTVNLQFIGNQWVDGRTLTRPIVTSNTLMHGETDNNGNYATVVGVQQWVVDNLAYAGQSASVLGNAVRGLSVNLLNRVAGFVSADGITAQTDNFGIIPSENVNVILYQSPAIAAYTYSGVIVEWTGAGYSVIGYDSKNPSFTIIPPNQQSPTGVITLGTGQNVTIYTWSSGTYYRVGVYVNYDNSVYQCVTAHTSSATFNESYWNPTPGVTNTIAPSITTYLLGLNTTQSVPYGTVFSTIQEVGNFLLSWERWLVSCGWVFDQLDESNGTTFNWTHATKDFLTWAQISWKPGNFVSLSPGATGLKFETTTGTVMNVEDAVTGFYGLLDRGGNPIYSNAARVYRLDGEVQVWAQNADIYACTVEISDIEHCLSFSNETIFDDVIYLPLYNQKQPRIMMIGFKSSDWVGRLDAPGYVVLNDQMYSNFEKTPEDIRLMFDIESVSRPDLKEYAQSNIGYSTRTYLENLLINQTEQFEFYQGMIQQKGTPGVFEKLLRSQRVTSNSTIAFLEEWAIRYPTTFGAPINPLATFNLLQSSLHRDPQFVIFDVPTIADETWAVIPNGTDSWAPNTYYAQGSYVLYENVVYQSIINQTSSAEFDPSLWTEIYTTWIDQPKNTGEFFPTTTKPSKVNTAGFVRLSDVQYTVVNAAAISSFYTAQYSAGNLVYNTGERIWIYANTENTWDVLRVFDIGEGVCTVNNVVSSSQDSSIETVRLYITGTMNLVDTDIGSMICIQGPTYSIADLNGINYILAFDNEAGTIDLTTTYVTTGFNFTGSSNPQPAIKIIRSVRFENQTVMNAFAYDWTNTDMVWLNSYTNNRMAIIGYDGTEWFVMRNQPDRIDPSVIITASVYNNGETISGQQLLVTTPLVDDLTIVDPIMGYFPGSATKEISFTTDVDPAIYSTSNEWGSAQTGMVWWDTSAVLYLDPYTDEIGQSNERDYEELQSRIENWATIAPNTSVDVYEWIGSTLTPTAYVAASTTDVTGSYGSVYDVNSYTTESIYSSSLATYITYYYFWVSGLEVVPDLPFRNKSVYEVASLLTTPVSQGLEWIGAISQNSILISGVSPYLNDNESVVKIELDTPSRDHVHAQWTLMRPNDSTSLPPEWLWRKIRDSLAGFDDAGFNVPNIGNVTNEQK